MGLGPSRSRAMLSTGSYEMPRGPQDTTGHVSGLEETTALFQPRRLSLSLFVSSPKSLNIPEPQRASNQIPPVSAILVIS